MNVPTSYKREVGNGTMIFNSSSSSSVENVHIILIFPLVEVWKNS